MTPLGRHIIGLIAAQGPLCVAEFMTLVLSHPRWGYYATRDPFGVDGDFTTAPEVSQMFGELIGLWCVDAWRGQGAPAPALLVELGPGRGTLMADLRRSARQVAPDFGTALSVHLIETSPALRERQRALLGDTVSWHDDLSAIPDGPLFLVANEFFDALPIRQFVRTKTGWAERYVTVNGTSDDPTLSFAVSPDALPGDRLIPAALTDAPSGSLFERRPVGEAICAKIAARIADHGGAALIVDYGHAPSALGDTLQAVKAHRFHDPLTALGEADITAHVDFDALSRAARANHARACGPLTQGAFLKRLGIETRAQALKHRASASEAKAIDVALERLTGDDAMGRLFKVLAIVPRDGPPPAGFEDWP